MYEAHFGLSSKPFSLLPDANFLYFSKRHKRVVNLLEYGSLTHAGFMVITGEVGAGKTTIIRHFLKHLNDDVAVGVITNPSETLGRLFGWIADAFELEVESQDDVKIYNAFVDYLLTQYAAGNRTVLIIDEAQNMSMQMLEDLRMLSNVNNERDQLLQTVLVGQPELLATLKRPDLRQFVQRISVHCHLTPLSAEETQAYIRHRLQVVGGDPTIFDEMACAAVHYFGFGVPRLINLMCDHALMYAYAEDEEVITLETIYEVVSDRNNSGLSSFRELEPGQNLQAMPLILFDVLQEMRGKPVNKADNASQNILHAGFSAETTPQGGNH